MTSVIAPGPSMIQPFPMLPAGDGSDIGAVEIGSGPAPTFVVSRKIHDGAFAIFDIPLNAQMRLETSAVVAAQLVITRLSLPLPPR